MDFLRLQAALCAHNTPPGTALGSRITFQQGDGLSERFPHFPEE